MLAQGDGLPHTCRVSPPTGSPTSAQAGPAGAVQAAKAVFFDFDGPICDVFSSRPATGVAEELKKVAKAFHCRLPAPLAASRDPHGILRGLRLAGLASGDSSKARRLTAALEEKLAELETTAAKTARPTPGAHELVSALHQHGKRLLVTSNNAEAAVTAHLQSEGMAGWFDHVVGRSPADPLLMKPHPYCVNRALELVRLPAVDCLLIGDQLTDAQAAGAAGVPFLGYARDEAHAAALREAQAGDVTVSLGLLSSGLTVS